MPNAEEKWIEIARTGIFTDSAGRPQEFTAADLGAIAAAYNPTLRDAPLCIGHPKDNAPAFGWVQKLKSEGEKLFASFAQVPSEVKDLVAKHHYRHVSMSLMPDRLTLRHIALLGAAQPAIDGLRAVELTHGENAICIEFETPQGGSMPTPEELQQQIGALQQQLEALKTENAELKKKLEANSSAQADAEKKTDEVAAEFSAYKEGVETHKRQERLANLVKTGKVRPAEQADVLSFAATLARVTEPVEFAAPDGKRETLSTEERYFRELEARPMDGRFMDFTSPAPAHSAGLAPAFTAAEMAKKL